MDFSERTTHTGPPPAFSPDGIYVAHAQDCRLVVREADSLALVALFSCSDRVEEVAWAPNSDHLLAGLFRTGGVQVFSVTDSSWSCSIGEGSAGCVAARWSPSGRHVLLTADFCIRLSVWSLEGQTCLQLPGPKHPSAGLAFSPDGTRLAVAQRSACKDSIAMYDTTSWELAGRWSPGTQDLADLAWSPEGGALAVWDAATAGHALMVFTPAGESLAALSRPGPGLGIKATAWSPSGQLLGVGGFDGELQLLNSFTWAALASLPHPGTVVGPAGLVAYTEVEEVEELPGANGHAENRGEVGNGTGGGSLGPPTRIPRLSPSKTRAGSPGKEGRAGSPGKEGRAGSPGKETRPWAAKTQDPGEDGEAAAQTRSRFLVSSLPLALRPLRPAVDKPNPKMGIGAIWWSHDGSYFASRCDATPNVVLMACSGTSKVYLWTPEGASCVHVPLPGLRPGLLTWHATQASLLLASRDSFACAFL